ncbi:hypothetical protein [Candidatus Poriferisodalis sp.]|uniref:hypothetical protein n=1 Tax=Candidatus Poriferisodalis sp. TaxID=3101277 RepID=UPI003B020B27
MAGPEACRRRKLAVAAPSLIVAIPLVGQSLLGDDRRRLYLVAHEVGSNLLRAIGRSLDKIDTFLDDGNFRPLGRAVENIERAAVFDVAEATGLPPHAVNGLVRMALLVLLAFSAYGLLAAMLRSSGVERTGRHPLAVLYPMVLATVLVAGDHYSPITSYHLVLLGSVVLTLTTALWVARDRDMTQRRFAWHEPAAMILLGAALAGTHDLAYVAPPFAAAFVLVRAGVGGLGSRLLRLACTWRWLSLSAGFLAVFVPVRIEIARRCATATCYAASQASLTTDALGRTVDRLLTGAPPAGWRHAARLADGAGVSFGLTDLATNMLLAVLLIATAFVTVAAARRATDASAAHWQRTAVGLASLGAVAAFLPALMAGLSGRTQEVRPRIGEAWRETVMVQVGWSFMAAAVLACAFGLCRKRRTVRAAAVTAAVVLGGTMTLTLLANARLAQADRVTPLQAVTSEIATAVVHFDPTEAGNERRCRLIEDYSAILPSPQQWVGGPGVWSELDRLTADRHGVPYCDPARLAGGSP